VIASAAILKEVPQVAMVMHLQRVLLVAMVMHQAVLLIAGMEEVHLLLLEE